MGYEGDIRVGLCEGTAEFSWWESLTQKEKDELLTLPEQEAE